MQREWIHSSPSKHVEHITVNILITRQIVATVHVSKDGKFMSYRTPYKPSDKIKPWTEYHIL